MRTFLLAIFLLVAVNSHSQNSTGSMHCLGNGQYCAYQDGVEIKSLFGPTYSSPSYIQLNLRDKNITVTSSRIPGTAIWKHTLMLNDEKVGEITDFVDAKLPVFVRRIDARKPFTFSLDVLKDKLISQVDNTTEYQGEVVSALLIHKDRGLPVYSVYEHPYEQFHQIIVRNNAAIRKTLSDSYDINISPGQSDIYFIGGPFYQECTENTLKVISLNYKNLYDRTLKDWGDFTKRRHDFPSLLTGKNPNRDRILEQIDNVAVLLKTQQSIEGGEIAGHKYHLAYIRDQYGVSRGFLALGYYEEAKKILDFYWQIWQKFGVLHNAQAIGIPGIFHIHENDEVEQTGYLIIQAFDYLKKTNDVSFVKTISPMLQWAWNVQKKNLVRNMLPFNGDETYVAGGILPRTELNDGSAESTLLFIQGGLNLLPFLKDKNLWNKDSIKNDEKLLLQVSNHYPDNFIKGGRIIANNPSRVTVAEMPNFRHGGCAGGHGLVYTKKDKNGNYLCPKCLMEGKQFPPYERKSFYIPSIALTPLYVGSDLIPDQLLKQNIDSVKKSYSRSGQYSFRFKGKTSIGYDYGILLYALTKYHDPFDDQVFEDAMSVVNKEGAWVEYYVDGKPMGCQYRPWESAINIEAITEYALSKEKK